MLTQEADTLSKARTHTHTRTHAHTHTHPSCIPLATPSSLPAWDLTFHPWTRWLMFSFGREKKWTRSGSTSYSVTRREGAQVCCRMMGEFVYQQGDQIELFAESDRAIVHLHSLWRKLVFQEAKLIQLLYITTWRNSLILKGRGNCLFTNIVDFLATLHRSRNHRWIWT